MASMLGKIVILSLSLKNKKFFQIYDTWFYSLLMPHSHAYTAKQKIRPIHGSFPLQVWQSNTPLV